MAVDVSTEVNPLVHSETALDVLIRMDEIGEALFRKHLRDIADVVICPEVSGIEWFDFSSPAQLIAAGRTAAARMVGKLAEQQNRLLKNEG